MRRVSLPLRRASDSAMPPLYFHVLGICLLSCEISKTGCINISIHHLRLLRSRHRMLSEDRRVKNTPYLEGLKSSRERRIYHVRVSVATIGRDYMLVPVQWAISKVTEVFLCHGEKPFYPTSSYPIQHSSIQGLLLTNS